MTPYSLSVRHPDNPPSVQEILGTLFRDGRQRPRCKINDHKVAHMFLRQEVFVVGVVPDVELLRSLAGVAGLHDGDNWKSEQHCRRVRRKYDVQF